LVRSWIVKKSGMLELAGQDRGFQGDAKIIIIINQSITSIEHGRIAHRCQSR